jgi:hypothetical protein
LPPPQGQIKSTPSRRRTPQSESVLYGGRKHATGKSDEPRDTRREPDGVDAAADAKPTDKEIRLFNGKDLTGWDYYLADPNAKMEDVWSVDREQGILICKGSPLATSTPSRTTPTSS